MSLDTILAENSQAREHMDQLQKLQLVAKQWRDSWDSYPDGVVLIWNMKVYGWKSTLREPSAERPGSIAIEADGRAYIAEGGDDQNGAEKWVLLAPAGDLNKSPLP